jgi:uncharacterized protein YecE (DUF72 family)
MCQKQIYCGPSNVSHPEWEQRQSPGPRHKGFHSLELLAKHFNCVEISSSFDEFVKPEVANVWLRKVSVNPQFLFTAKLNRRFTHDRILDCDEVKRFKDGLWPLVREKKLGCLLMQFPWSFRYTGENRDYFIRLRRTFHEFPLVAEMRHASWMLDEAIGTFIDYRVGFCNIDQPVYTKAMPPTSFLTSAVGYVRLHGRNCFNWFGAAEHPSRTPRYDYVYSEQELREWANRIEQISGYAAKSFVIANNGGDGKAIATAMQMNSMLSGKAGATRRPAVAQAPLFTEFHGRAVA